MTASSYTAKGGLITVILGNILAFLWMKYWPLPLFAWEADVIDKDVRLTVSNPSTEEDKFITVSVEKDSKSLISKGSWSCHISVSEEAAKDADYAYLGKYIQSNLQIPGKDLDSKQKQNKELLVKACSKKRKTINFIGFNDDKRETVGSLSISKNNSKLTFDDHPDLDFLLINSLYGAEEKVFNEKVGFDVSESGEVKIIAISTQGDTSTWGKEENGANKYYWECKITKTGDSTRSTGFTVDEVKKLLPSDENENDSNKNNQKKHLVELCSKHRETSSKDKQVKASLNLPNDNNASNKWKEYLFGIKTS